jgi:hypothetical protein
MSLTKFTNLNFDELRTSIRDYIRSNSNFTDYDFEGSNLATIVNILAYNTYISSYNANVISNEVFIDSATLRENVASLARLVGYVPRSITAPRAKISFFVDLNSLSIRPLTLTLKKGLVAGTKVSFGGLNFTFCIPADITVPVVNGIAFFDDVDVYEGTFITESYTIDSNNPNQRIILSNPKIDTSLLTVTVKGTEADNSAQKYMMVEDLFDIDGSSKVFFIQEVEDQRYELIFGDGVFGKKLDNLNFIEASYIITNGPAANGIFEFSFAGRLFDNNGRIVTSDISSITTVQQSSNGQGIEDVNTIRKYAPRFYSTQNRAVTPRDYETIVPRIYPEVESISAFGGEEMDPPRFGRVYISIKPQNGRFVPNSIKDNIKRELRKYSVAGIVPEIIDLKYIYVEYDSVVYYNSNSTLSPNDLSTIILTNLTRYSKSNDLNRYGARFKYSKFLKLIDDSDVSVTSNITKIYIRRDLRASLNQFASYEICFGNQFYINCNTGFNIRSSGFTVAGILDTLYLSDIPNPDGRTGNIVFFKLTASDEYKIVKQKAGTIDYEKGEIKLFPVNFTSTVKVDGAESIVEISGAPASNDVIGLQDLYLQLDVNNSVLNTVSDFISSGSNTSGSNFVQTSSYNNGKLIRA